MKNTHSVPSDEQIKSMSVAQISSLIGDTMSSAQRLKDMTDRLPEIKDNPESKAAAEKAYAERDELAAQVKSKIQALDRARLCLEHNRDQAYNNLQVISANQTRLCRDKPKREFSNAEAQLANQYQSTVKLLDRLQKAFDIAQKVLAQAYSKQFPGGLPRKDPKLDVNPFDTMEVEERKLKDKLNREIKNVLEMG